MTKPNLTAAAARVEIEFMDFALKGHRVIAQDIVLGMKLYPIYKP
jgi:hypothetical protein